MPNDEDLTSPIEGYRENYHIMQTRSGDSQEDCNRLAILLSIREGKAVAFQRPDGQGVTAISKDEAYRALPKVLLATLQTISDEELRSIRFLERLHGKISEEVDILAALMQRNSRIPLAQADRIKAEALEHCAKAQAELIAALSSLKRNLGHAYDDMYGAKIAPDK
ncbi:MAG TPA: hypothetical protein VLB83_05395 [Candidatus Paceibacterota bacterium]|nr:hypothetical protein [Candidatus Paceibacterota bacterium]